MECVMYITKYSLLFPLVFLLIDGCVVGCVSFLLEWGLTSCTSTQPFEVETQTKEL